VRRRQFITLLGGAAVWPMAALAQQSVMPVIGYLSARSLDAEGPLRGPFLKALEAAGFFVGRNVAIEYRFADGREDRLPLLAAELVQRPVALLTAFGRGTALVAKAATATIPIVFVSGLDPVRDGLVDSLNRPGGNATGIGVFTSELGPKRLALLRELLPKPGTIAFVADSQSSTTPVQREEMRTAAESVGQPLLIVEANTDEELRIAFAKMSERNIAAVVFGASHHFQVISDKLVALAARHRIPALYEWREFVAAGGLMSYNTSRTEFASLAGTYVARILKGTNPADLPVLQSTKFEFIINLKTAKALGVTISDNLLSLADEVIE